MAETVIRQNESGRFPVLGTINVEIDLGGNSSASYAVVKKDVVPPSSASTYDGIRITWFNAFGVRERNSNGALGAYARIPYTVVVKLPTGKRLFAYYNNRVYEITEQPTGTLQNLRYRTENGITTIALTAGDPPVGYGP